MVNHRSKMPSVTETRPQRETTMDAKTIKNAAAAVILAICAAATVVAWLALVAWAVN